MLEYRQENEIDDKVIIPSVLAVDAVSLTPHITIDKNGRIKGLKDDADIKLSE